MVAHLPLIQLCGYLQVVYSCHLVPSFLHLKTVSPIHFFAPGVQTLTVIQLPLLQLCGYLQVVYSCQLVPPTPNSTVSLGSTSSCLQHENHPYLEPSAIPRSEKDLSDDDKVFLEILFNQRASNTMISRIFEQLKGREFGTFIPKTIYNMNAKSQKLLDIANGITPDMSDAEKCLKHLEL